MNKTFVITLTIASLILLSVFITGCSSTPVSNSANTSNVNQIVVVPNANAPVNANIASNISTVNPTNPANPTNPTNTANVSAAPNSNRKASPATKEPTPQIGSGANDLLLFTQLRNSLSVDPDLQTYVIIEVKEGNVTLSGKAASAEKKAQAEQLIKAVNGVKSVKNNITVSK